MTPAPTRRALVLPELVAALAVAALLAAALLLCAAESRRQSSLGDNLANLRQIGAAAAAYGADNAGLVYGFTWRGDTDYGYGPAGSDLAAAGRQAWHILRTRTDTPELFLGPPPPNWIPHLVYSHLPLLDYLGEHLPSRAVIAPEDRLRHLWAGDPAGMDALPPDQRPPGADETLLRWAYSSSYELPPAFYSPDAVHTVYQHIGGPHNTFSMGQVTPAGRRLDEIALPAHKVMLFEQYQRHFGPRELYFGYAEARIPLLLADGAAAVRRSADANRGFYPPSPRSLAQFTRILYMPATWEPPTASGNEWDIVTTYYRFTRSGLRGRDFGGPEVPWVD